jgi:hypothetical protein
MEPSVCAATLQDPCHDDCAPASIEAHHLHGRMRRNPVGITRKLEQIAGAAHIAAVRTAAVRDDRRRGTSRSLTAGESMFRERKPVGGDAER